MSKSDTVGDTRERLITTALDLIEANNGVRGVNLRGISAAVGCAHTNAYNYFESLEGLLWHALLRALGMALDYTNAALALAADREEAFAALIGSLVDFAQARPGIYRFIWLERFATEPPAILLERIAEAKRQFAQVMNSTAGDLVGGRAANAASDLVHTYVHGEICKLISGRRFEWSVARSRALLIARARRLLELAVADEILLGLDIKE